MRGKVNIADVMIWGATVGSVVWDETRDLGFFEYDRRFLKAPVELSPLMMPKKKEIYSFPMLNKASYRGLPGLLADSLPDKFGNLLINRWLKEQGRDILDFNPIERLCYTGNRGMGAIEFKPSIQPESDPSTELEIKELVQLANIALQNREHLKPLTQLISIGTSAGGARAKAVIAWNEKRI